MQYRFAKILCLLVCASAACGGDSIHPYPLFPSKVPGRPGLAAPEIWPHYQEWEKARKAGDEEKAKEIIKRFQSDHFLFGYPQFLPYPGSIEHVRCIWQRYLPPYPLYNHNTLAKNVVLRKHKATAADCVAFKEPVYWTSQWNNRFKTSDTRDVSKVYPWKPGKSIEFTVGPLKPKMMYVVRVIGAIKNEPKTKVAKQLVFRYEINDRPDGSTSTYFLRGRAWDQFYDVASCLWHVNDKRTFKIKVTLEPESDTTLYTHNIDVHNIFGECAMRAGKKISIAAPLAKLKRVWEQNRQNLPKTEAKRGSLRSDLMEYHKLLRSGAEQHSFDNAQELLASIEAPPLTGDERAARDRDLWRSLPPLNHVIATKIDRGKEGVVRADWTSDSINDWSKPWRFIKREIPGRAGRKSRIVEEYTWDDMWAYKRLPGTEDRGYGVKLDVPVTAWNKPKYLASYMAWQHMDRWRKHGASIDKLINLYQRIGDQHAARDAAFLLARMAYHYPALRGINYLGWAEKKNPTWRGMSGRGGRYDPAGWGIISPVKLSRCYDKLFHFIDGNEELAQGLGRHIPWVKTSDDVKLLFEVYLVQYTARNLVHFRRATSGINGELLTVVTVQNDTGITRPWMEFLFSRTWEYPSTLAGIDDYCVTSVTREGVSNIGSYCYTGAAGLSKAAATHTYTKNGGDPKYDLGDFRRYAKSASSPYFAFEGRVGGGFYPGVGDVGGPARGHDYYGRKIGEFAGPGWALTREPQFAWYQVNVIGREGQTDEEWDELQEAASTVTVNPLLNQRSRALSDWFGVLEGGQGNPDFRFHQAVAVNVGNGFGHSHDDTMDLRIWALGANMSGDFGQRAAYGRPRHNATYSHNLVEVDGDGSFWTGNPGEWDGFAWVRSIFDAPGAASMTVESIAPPKHKNVKLFRRQVALIQVDAGVPSKAAVPAKDPNVTLPASYVFDVFRVSGGKKHTYCFHGSVDDNLLAPGGFEVNVKNRQLIDEGNAEGASSDEKDYLRNFRWGRVCKELSGYEPGDIDKEWVADPADDTLVATWRMGEKAYRTSLSGNAAAGGRKYMRMTLFGAKDHRVLHGINTDVNGNNPLNPGFKHYSGRCIYVQKNTKTEGLQSAFTALLEPYDGEPIITASKQLTIPGNESDAKRAIAVSLKTRYGTEDLLFSDARPEEVRKLPGDVAISGEFACVSRDKQGLCRATLTGGTRLTAPDIDLKVSKAAYTGEIVAVDLLERTIEVKDFPALAQLAGSSFEIGNDLHKTSFEIDSITKAENGNTILHCRKGLEIMRATVLRIDYKKNQLVTNIAMRYFPGRNDGLLATNGKDLTKRWRVRYEAGGTRFDGHTFTLKGRQLKPGDFTVGGKLSVWEFGVGDTVTLKTGVSVQRHDDGSFKVHANAPFTLKISGKELTWTPEKER